MPPTWGLHQPSCVKVARTVLVLAPAMACLQCRLAQGLVQKMEGRCSWLCTVNFVMLCCLARVAIYGGVDVGKHLCETLHFRFSEFLGVGR